MVRNVHNDVARAVARIPEISCEALVGEIERGDCVVLDIREIDELWSTGMIAGSHHVPRGVLEWFADPTSPLHADYLSQERKVVVYSYVGERSAVAALTLTEFGYRDVRDLRVGLAGWTEAGHKIVPVHPPLRQQVETAR